MDSGTRATVAGVPGRLWSARRPRASPILLVAGVTPAGPADPRVARVASALRAAARTVFVPRLVLSDHELDDEDIQRLVAAAQGLGDRSRDVTIIGFSFGGSYALVAAADERIAHRVRLVASFGAYADLTGVLRAATTGMSLQGGRRVRWDAGVSAWGAGSEAVIDTDFAGILLVKVAELVPAVGRSDLEAVLDGAADIADLPPAAGAACRLLMNRRPERVGPLAQRLPDALSTLLERLSPRSAAARVRCPVVLMHAVNDPTVPFAEMRRLQDLFPDASAYPVHLFTHVDFVAAPRQAIQVVRDVSRLWRFTGRALA